MEHPVRILLLFTVMDRGGAETMIMNYYRHIDKTRVQFDFMVHRQKRGSYDDEIEMLGGKIYRMLPICLQNISEYQKKLAEFFQQHSEYKIIHSHMSELGYFVFKESSKHNIPFRICHAHNAPDFTKESLIEWMKLLPRLFLIHGIRKYTTHFFVCSNIAGLWLYGKKYASQFVFMKNAVVIEDYRYKQSVAEEWRRKLGVDNQLVLCHIGRFNTQKNHSFLIDIFFEIKKREKNSVLLLIGDGYLKKNIEEKVERMNLTDSVRFMGVRNDVSVLLQASDFLVFPSIYEGLSVVLVEAQTSGIKCVFTDSLAEETVISSENVKTYSLKKTSAEWAELVLSERGYVREDVSEIMIEKGWDVEVSAKWLESYYIQLIQSIDGK